MKRILTLCIALATPCAAHWALAQNVQLQVGTQPSVEVERLAPQLVAFAGGAVNFANLANGLAQVVTFTPTGTMTPVQIAQTLETARQSLISRGIAAPTAQQIAATLIGGTLSTPAGNAAVSALVPATTPAIAAGATAAAAGTTLGTPSPAAAIQQQNSAAAGASAASTAVHNTSDSPLPRGIADTPPLPVPGVTAATQAPAAMSTAPTSATPFAGSTATSSTPPRLAAPAPFGVAPAGTR
jgi:hypothetical protein